VSIEDKRDEKAKELLKDSVFLEYIHSLCLCGHTRYIHHTSPIRGEIVGGKCERENCICTVFKLRDDQECKFEFQDIILYFLGKDSG
jgi:hypothetical protein